MPTPAYTPLATVTLDSSTSAITFSSIPATYRDLALVVNGSLNGLAGMRARINGDTGNNYSRVAIRGQAAGASSLSGLATEFILMSGLDTDERFILAIDFMDYSATDKHTTLLCRTDSVGQVDARALRWANTSAVTSIFLFPHNDGQMNAGTTLSLYGVKA
jgi:hypothetical protein